MFNTRTTAVTFVVVLATMLLAGPAGARTVDATDWSRVASGVQRDIDTSVTASRQARAQQVQQQGSADTGGEFPWATTGVAALGLMLLAAGGVSVTRHRRRGGQFAPTS